MFLNMRPCPECKDRSFSITNSGSEVRIICQNCKYTIGGKTSQKSLIRDWNKLFEKKENKLGLTHAEQEIMNYLFKSYNIFIKLEKHHPDELRDFTDGIHKLQGILAMRIVRRDYPEEWFNTKKE